MISIIIPVYNGAKHIKKCVISLLRQQNINFEVIFVNDGSTDDSMQLLQKYSDTESRFVIVNQENAGVAIARETGVSHSRGSYIMFMDIDDTIKPDTISYFNQLILNNSSIDVFVSGYDIIYSNRVETVSFEKSTVDNIDFLKLILTQGRWALWAKVYKKSLFSNVLTPSDIKVGEDAIVLIQLILSAENVFISNLSFYNYIQHDTSVSYHKSDEMVYQGIRAAFVIQKLLDDSEYKEILQEEIDAMFLLFFSNSLRRGYVEDPDLLDNVKQHVSFGALKSIGFLKSVYILLNLYGGIRVYILFQRIFNKFYKS